MGKEICYPRPLIRQTRSTGLTCGTYKQIYVYIHDLLWICIFISLVMHYGLCIYSTWRAHGHARRHFMPTDGGRGRGLLPVMGRGRGRGRGRKKVVSAGITPAAIFNDMYEQVAPESNRTNAVLPLTKNIPCTTSGAACASLVSRWLRRPRVADPLS